MTLCWFCQEIPDHFSKPNPDPEVDSLQYALDHAIPHLPIPYLQNSAASGCSLCKILASGIDERARHLPLTSQATSLTNLRLAMIDPNQAFDVCVGFDDYNHVFYYHIPSSFSKLGNSISPLYLLFTDLGEMNNFRSLNWTGR